MALEQLRAGEIHVGMTLPFDVYDRNHRLLMSRGYLITSEVLSERLMERGMFAESEQLEAARWREPSAKPVKRTSVSIFALLNKAQSELRALLNESPARPQFDQAVFGIAADIQNVCRLDGDAAIASIFLDRYGTYALRHMVDTAVLAELILHHVEPDAARRHSTLAAALTMNIAMLELQEALYNQSAPLTDAERRAILAHAAGSVGWLKQAGVTDTAWLEAVAQHHEQINGTGYPDRIAGDALRREARAIGLAERYCAMVIERAYRPQMSSNVVFKKLLEQKEAWDPTLGALLVREVGAYPPGSYVRLVKGEIAIVLKRTAVASRPMVRVLISTEGRRLEGFPKRNTREPNFQIVGTVTREQVRVEHDFHQLWDLTTVAVPELSAAA